MSVLFTTLYEDDDVLAVDKPAGMVVIPARDEAPEECLRHRLEAQRAEKLWVVHRIDRDTSGVVLFARNASAHQRLNDLFAAHKVSKSYLAITRGAPPAARGTIDIALHSARKGKMRPAELGEADAQACRTHYEVLSRKETPAGAVALVRARPETGRQHQIRVHMRWAKSPLLVDPVYGRASEVRGAELGLSDALVVSRLTLHATSVEFAWGERTIKVEAPLAHDLKALVDALF